MYSLKKYQINKNNRRFIKRLRKIHILVDNNFYLL